MPRTNIKSIVCLGIVILCAGLCGCASYVAPGRGANLGLMSAKTRGTPDAPAEQLEPIDRPEDTGRDIQITRREPTARFPAHVVVVRIQEPGYTSMTNKGIGAGTYSVITVRDIEKDEDFERLARLPFVAEISPLSRLLLPSSFQSDRELRQAAERVQADMLLVYTVDTTFLDTDKSTPVTVISLGLMPTVDVRVVTTVSALLLDTQTGYVYATTEQTVHEQVTTGALSTRNAFDTLRLKTERRAFEDFLDEFETLWPRIVETYKK